MKILEGVPLAPHTTLQVGGRARYFANVASVSELQEAIRFAQPRGIPVFVLGEGANVLISDKGFDGLVVHLTLRDIVFGEYKDGLVKVTADAGALWDDVVQVCVQKGLRGLESTSGIPGSVGAAVVGNIAAYGQAVSDTLGCVDVVDVEHTDGELERIEAARLGLAYRYSDFQNEKLESKIIVRTTFILDTKTVPKLEYKSALRVAEELGLDWEHGVADHRRVILETRRRAGSLLVDGDAAAQAKTAGSFFRNPVVPQELAEKILTHEEFGVSREGILKQNTVHGGSAARVSAAHVLLAAGFRRGQQWGTVRLHPQHILKIENTGNATAQEIYDVSRMIMTTVKNKLDVTLEPEVRCIGEFDR